MRAAFAVQAALYLGGAVSIGIAYGARLPSSNGPLEGERFACTVEYVHDGDTFRCTDGRNVLVAGIDARELDGSCLPGHPCPAAAPEQATAELKRLLDGRTLACQVDGTTPSRVAAYCRRSDGLDLSCAMLASGTVAKWELFWRNHRCR